MRRRGIPALTPGLHRGHYNYSPGPEGAPATATKPVDCLRPVPVGDVKLAGEDAVVGAVLLLIDNFEWSCYYAVDVLLWD